MIKPKINNEFVNERNSYDNFLTLTIVYLIEWWSEWFNQIQL